jgi:5-oxoprolinase (ATP-hydrolysing) subunit A
MGACVDLNSDVGESYGAYVIGCDAKLLQLVTSANVACGWHAGDPTVMDRTVRLAARLGVAVGAHPGYPDRLGFGRRHLEVSAEEARAYVLYQVGALDAFARGAGTRLQHVKLHGAFYNAAAADDRLAQPILDAVRDFDPELILLGLSGSRLLRLAREQGLRTAHEVFPDRAYTSDGALASRSLPGSVIEDPDWAARRAVRMVTEGVVEAVTGEEIQLLADSLCIHGDNPKAVLLAARVREALVERGIQVRRLGDFAG